MARQIEAYKLRTEIAVDAAKGRRELQATEKDVGKVSDRFKHLGKDINAAMKGVDVSSGRKFGENFGASATSAIVGSIKSLGTTIGSVVGTAIAPGIGTAIGSTIGSAVDLALEKVTGPILETIKGGIELNKMLEETLVEFTTFTGSKSEGLKYLNELKKLSTDNGLRMGVLVDASERTYDFAQDLKLVNTIMRASIEQAADFGGSEKSFIKVADALGLIAEKGELGGKELQKLYRLGIDAPKRLAEATGMSVNTIKRMMAQGRIDGAVASRLISESIIREKAGFAQRLSMTTTAGAERRFGTLTEIRAAEGTQKATQGLGDFYRTANDVLDSPQAQKFVAFIDEKTGSLINMVEKASRAGINVATGIAGGITSGESLKALGSSFTSLGDYTERTLKNVFEIKSPSERTAREIGIPIGEGIADGITRGFVADFRNKTAGEIVAELESLLEHPRVKAFFEAIRRAEGGELNIMAGGRRVNSGALHPGEIVPKSQWFRGDKGPSSAAGNFQITRTNWRTLASRLGLTNFSDPHQQELAAIKLFADREGGAGVRALLSGNVDRARGIAALDWTSTPGSKIGGGGQLSTQRWMGHYNQALAANGAPITSANPMPVYFSDPRGGASMLFGGDQGGSTRFGAGKRYSVDVGFDPNSLKVATAEAIPPAKKAIDLFKDLGGRVLPDLNHQLVPFDQAMLSASGTLADFGLGLPPLTSKMLDFGQAAREEFALTNEALKVNQRELIRSIDLREALTSAISQAAGFLPQQEVGKKRGFFSKLLGFAAPFLSFIPGIGPILSQIAGIGSNAAAGNWAGVATGIAGGFSTGGAFNRGAPATVPTGGGGRMAAGGPVRRGRSYIVGEYRPELFVPNSDGYVHPRVGGGGGDTAAAIASLEQTVRLLSSRLSSMRPGDVVTAGAHGFSEAMSRDAGLIRLMGQHLRLA